MSLAQLLQPFALSQPDHPALVDGALTLSYAELARRAEAAAGFLKQNHVIPGHVVCIGLAPADHWTWVFVLGAWRLGALPVLLGEHPVAQIRSLGGRGAIVVGSEGSSLLRVPDIRPVPVSETDKQALTSTQAVVGLYEVAVADARAGLVVFGVGEPARAAAINRSSIIARAEQMAQLLTLDTDSRAGTLLPDDASAGVELAVAVWRRGGTFMLAQPQASAGDAAAVPGRTHLVGTPARLRDALSKRDGAPAESLRSVALLGGPLTVELASACKAGFGVAPMQWLYSNESGMYTCGDQADFVAHPGCVGRALEGVELEFLGRDGKPVPRDQGGLMVVRTPWAAGAYLHGAATKAPFGLHGSGFRTGILARVSADGRVSVMGAVRMPSAPPANPADAPASTWTRGDLEAAVAALDGVREACVLSQPGAAGRPSVPAIVYVAADTAAKEGPLEPRIKALLGAGRRFHLIKVPALPRLDDGAIDRVRLAAALTTAIKEARQKASNEAPADAS